MDNEWKVVPVQRSYDMRVRAIIQFNKAEKAGKDRDDAMDAAFQAMLAAAPLPPSASDEREANIAELAGLVLTPDEHGGTYFNHVVGCTECCDCGSHATGDDDDLQHKPDCPSFTDEARHRRRLTLAYAIQATPSPGFDAAEQKPVYTIQVRGALHTWEPTAQGFKLTNGTYSLYAAPSPAASADNDKRFPFYELRFIMRVLSHEGSAPKEDWQTAYGMARAVFERWSKDRVAVPAASADEQKPLAYLIDWPDEPELGHYFAEEPTDAGRCRALVLAETAPLPAAGPDCAAKTTFSEVPNG